MIALTNPHRPAAVGYIAEKIAEPERVLAYVYCNYKEDHADTTSKIWSSVLQQLAKQYDPFPTELHTFRDKFIRKRARPTVGDLLVVLGSLSKLVNKTFIFIDALVSFGAFHDNR